MNDTVNEPSDQNDAPQDTQPPAPRRGSLSAKWSLIFGILAWVLAGIDLMILSVPAPWDRTTACAELLDIILAVITYSVPLSALLAVVFGHVSNRKVCHMTKLPRDRRAVAGLVLGYPMLLLNLFIILFSAGARSHPRRPSCVIHLKQMGLSFTMYAYENKDLFPELSLKPGILAASNRSSVPFLPEYMTDPANLFCAEKKGREEYEEWRDNPDPQVFLDHSSYVYLGYAIESEAEVEAFAEAYRQRVAQGLPFDEDLSVPPGKGNNGSDTIYRLREGVERYFITDINNPAASATAQSKIPVLIERLGNHEHEGGNVLYLDGHVKFIRYPGDWPMTEKTIAILKSIEAMRK